MGIRGYFRHIFTGKELGAAKPEERFFTEVAARIGVPAQRCVMVGNDYVKDIVGAKRASLRTVWFCPEPPGECAYPDADDIIRTMAELPGVLRQCMAPRHGPTSLT